MSKKLTRRTILRGLGATMALPMLDAMMPARAMAATKAAGAAGAASSAGGAAPVRMGFLFMPNGMDMTRFSPKAEGSNYDITPTLKPLAKLREHFNVLSGLAHNNARALGDGAGDHARSSAAFLTAAHPHKTAGRDIKLGVSVDQVAASKIGKQTRLPSLELGCDRGRQAGRCDSGYSCAYVNNISWRNETTPVPHEFDPAAVFDRLFGSEDVRASAEARERRLASRKSVLDFVAEDARRLRKELGKGDKEKLDEFETSVREIEQRIDRSRTENAEVVQPNYKRPDGVPRAYAEHIRLMMDLMVLAFQMDVTRVSSFMLARAGSNRSFRDLGVSEGHHHLSHHRGDTGKIVKISAIDRFYVEQFGYMIERMASIREGEGTLLDNCMVMLGSGISDGNRHSHHDLPVILAGRGGGAITTGRHVRYPKDTPLANLFVDMLDISGVEAQRFGDSTGRLRGLTA